MNDVEISIIIPVYNAAKMLPQCINSVLRQDFDKFELILINDASQDNSLEVMRNFEKKDNRIKVLSNEVNKGIEKTRLVGIAAAQGNYIMFMDNDDWLCKNILHKTYKIIKETDVDYVQFGVNRVIDKFGLIKRKSKSISQYGIIKNPELYDKYYISNFAPSPFDRFIWGKLYKKSLIEAAKIIPSGNVYDEDGFFHLLLWPHLSSIYVLKDVGYMYRWGGLTSRSYNPNYMPDLTKNYYLKKEEIKRTHYYLAEPFIIKGMVNTIKKHIYLMLCGKIPRNKILQEIESVFSEDFYNDIKQYYTINPSKDPFIKALLDKDIQIMYNIKNIQYKKDFIKNKIHDFRRIAYSLISRL